MEDQPCYKVVVLGSSGVGKTAMVQRLTEGTFPEDLQSTVGVEFRSFDVKHKGNTVSLHIWDTAGQEKFRSVAKAYFRNAVGAVLTYSCNSQSSFYDLDRWLLELKNLMAPNAVIILVGNKSDLTMERIVPFDEAEAFAQRHSMEYFEVSAKNGSNVEEAFNRLARLIYDKINEGAIAVAPKTQQTTKIESSVNTQNGHQKDSRDKKCKC